MKKQAASTLLALAMLLGLLPGTAFAAEGDASHSHPVCGPSCPHTENHAAVEWTALNQDSFTGGTDGGPKEGSGVTVPSVGGDNYILNEGSYYLTGNITVDKEIRIADDGRGGTVNLCLNGYTLTSMATGNKTSIVVPSGSTLDLCDCKSGGWIKSSADELLKVGSDANGIANLYGGILEAGMAGAIVYGSLTLDGATLKVNAGSAIDAQPNSTVTIKSGSVESSNAQLGTGWGMQILTPNFTMTGGTVTHTGSEAALYFGGAGGGTVRGGKITSTGNYGMLLSTSNPVTLSGNPTVSGKTAGIAIWHSGTITVGADLTGSYTVFRINWNSFSTSNYIAETKPFAFTTAANTDHSGCFTPAASMIGIAVRNSGEGGSQQVQLYRPHDYNDAWVDIDPDQHWKTCRNPGCDSKTELGKHEKIWKIGTTQHWQQCSKCGWISEKTDHAAAGDWQMNDKAHWKLCFCGSQKSLDMGMHSYDNDQDADCNICGYARAVPLTGTVTVAGTPKLGEKLTASVTGAPEGVELEYTWTAGGAALGTGTDYTPTANEVGKTLTVTVTAKSSRYTGSLTGTAGPVAKGDQAAPGRELFHVSDTEQGQSSGVIDVKADVDKLEYRVKPVDGSDPPYTAAPASLANLAAGFYEFRYKETDTHNASDITELEIRTVMPTAKDLTIHSSVHGAVTAVRNKINPGDTVKLTVTPDAGYELSSIAANYGGGQSVTPVWNGAAGVYTFIMPDAAVNVTAAFTAVAYTIDYQWAGVADGSFTVEDTSITLAAAVRDGFTLTGWSFTESGTVLTDVTAAVLIAKAVNRTVPLYPVWTENSSRHTHIWATEWTADDTHHWHACTGAGMCDATDETPEKAYGAHAAGGWEHNEAGHWKRCECGFQMEAGNHVFSLEDSTKCICGYTRDAGSGDTRGEVEVSEGAPQVTTDTETLKELAGTPAAGQTITVKLTVEKKDESADGAAEIQQAANGKTIEFLNLSLLKQVSGQRPEAITDTQGRVLEIVIPYDFTGKQGVAVYRFHSGSVQTLVRADTGAGGTFKLGTDSITIYATKFSTYAIGYTQEGGGMPDPTPPDPPSGDSSGSPATYPPTVEDSGHGRTEVRPQRPAQGDRVTVTLTPDSGYQIGGVSVTDRNGKPVTITDKGDGRYTFIQPGGKVTITASFTPISGGAFTCPKDRTCPIWPYTDSSATAWYHDGVHYCIERNLMVGLDSHTFAPDGATSRAMIAAILWRLEGSPAVDGALPFADVTEGAWYSEAVRWAAASGVVSGYGDGNFGPGDPITREQLAVVLWRYAGSPAAGQKLNFTDTYRISSYALEAVRWALENSILSGYSDGRADPHGMATRDQSAAMIMRFCAKI